MPIWALLFSTGHDCTAILEVNGTWTEARFSPKVMSLLWLIAALVLSFTLLPKSFQPCCCVYLHPLKWIDSDSARNFRVDTIHTASFDIIWTYLDIWLNMVDINWHQTGEIHHGNLRRYATYWQFLTFAAMVLRSIRDSDPGEPFQELHWKIHGFLWGFPLNQSVDIHLTCFIFICFARIM